MRCLLAILPVRNAAMTGEPALSDIEAPFRAAAMKALGPWFHVVDEAPVVLRDGHRGVIDVLAVPRDSRFSNFSLAFEIKARRGMVENGLALWFKQASDYVGAIPDGPYAAINSAFLWMVGMAAPCEMDRVRLRAMIDLAHQYRTGIASSADKGGFVLQMGPDEMFRSRGWANQGRPDDPWPGRAMERLTSARQAAGSRRVA